MIDFTKPVQTRCGKAAFLKWRNDTAYQEVIAIIKVSFTEGEGLEP